MLIDPKLLLYQIKEHFLFKINIKQTEKNSKEIPGSCKAVHDSGQDGLEKNKKQQKNPHKCQINIPDDIKMQKDILMMVTVPQMTK